MDKIVIFGAGNTGIRAYEQNCATSQIVAFFDNDEAKWGGQIKGIPIERPTEENFRNYVYDYVLIASVFGKREIEQQLLGFSVDKDRIQYMKPEPDVLSFFLKNLAEEFRAEQVAGAIAEVGVFQGASAEKMNRFFPDRKLHLFDTFEGFTAEDVKVDIEKSFSNARKAQYSDTSVNMVLERMENPENVIIHKGYFPDTAVGITEKFCFVRLDIDLYVPTVSALEFFHPLMVPGGCILIHDYFGDAYKGIRAAVAEYLTNHPEISKVPIGDRWSIALVGF